MPFQLQYTAEAAEMKVSQLPGLVRVDGPGFRTVKECRPDDGLVHLQFDVQVNTVAIRHGGLQLAEGLTSFGDPLGNLIIDSRVALIDYPEPLPCPPAPSSSARRLHPIGSVETNRLINFTPLENNISTVHKP
ncbi:unnamed protein product [Schistocephalus solidus]|uniref:Uncharacterized protein n=1 Tax=Schistocephalus solidus TaxID=70667 RepID=A0A3P7BWU1_SCHSO|nr:unnamed protein product [Schistocephalus solidus]